MSKKIIGLLVIMALHGCATTGTGTDVKDSSGTRHTLPLDKSKKLSFNMSGCKVEGGAIKNEGSYASAGSYGTLIATNSKSNVALDQYRVTCGALPAGGKASCVIQHIEGAGSFNDYGGAGCPDMHFKVTNFRVF
ncbi:MAG: hypothetical protein A3I83_10355 [Methylotenera sp. RIFCSPLOWO2_02_FULL_45_14]|nr:MAG: hypothetical protein A3I83_10355 [Methylotenera sp. RIFCSPLOWO2_02_FULL_45_14]